VNRKPSNIKGPLVEWKKHLLTRRQFLLTSAGGSLSALFPLPLSASTDNTHIWSTIEAVQGHLFPTEENAPGAAEIKALEYLKFVVTDKTLNKEDREFILKGAGWLEGMAQQLQDTTFVKLDEDSREKVLRRIAASDAGENWLSTLLLYIMEALLTDPVYGGNSNQVGWRWLQHVPGFPRPPENKTFPRLLS